MQPSDVTRVEGAAHNPKDLRHYMRIKPVARRVKVIRDGVVLAESTRAVRVLEVGRDLYDPVFYLPIEDVSARLGRIERSSHCPIKGDAAYFDLLGDDGAVAVGSIAWSYETPIEMAAELKGRIAFYAEHVAFEDMPL